MKVGFLGLGVMGYAMAGHLSKQGYDVCVYNRSTCKMTQWLHEYTGRGVQTVAQAVEDADVVFMCLGRDEDVIEVSLSEQGVIKHMEKGAILVDHTTTSAQLALKLAQACQSRAIDFLDAPISGGEVGAIEGKLSIMVGGEARVLEAVRKLLATYGQSITHIGKNGDGQRCKMVNQMAISGILQGLSEALLFGQHAQLDMEKVIQAISGGAAGSWQLTHRANTMLKAEYDFGFAIEWMIKDLSYAIEEAKRLHSPVPLNEMVLAQYQRLNQQGHGRADTSVLIESLKSENHD